MSRIFLLLLFLGASVASGQTVRLTEIMPVNTTGLLDDDGTPQPWIEVWNVSTTSKAVMTGFRLNSVSGTGTTLASWAFPFIEIMPAERYIIFASAKNRIAPTSPLHTDFKLDPAGAGLQLRNSVGTVVSQFFYPAVPANVSWGRDETDTFVTATQTGIYENPTPGARNNYSGSGVAGKVLFDKPDQAFSSPFNLTLTQATPDPDAEIRYTTNRAPVTSTSPVYTGPIVVSTTTLVRARVFKSGLLPGETEGRGYLQLNATTLNFTSSMPLMVLSNFSLGTPPESGDQISYLWVWEPQAPDNLSRFSNPPVLSCRTVIDRRGSSTLGNPKHNLNLELRKNRDDDERDEELLGMPAHSDWVLGAPYDFDRSDLHNPLAYAMSNAVGRYAPATRQAEVFIDTNGGQLNTTGTNSTASDYFGIYNVTEKIRRGNDRVDVKKLDIYDNGEVTKTGGWIWKVDRRDAGDVGFTAGGQGLLAYYYPKEISILSPQRDPQEKFLTSYINSFNVALQGANFKDPVLGYAAWLDVPAALDHHLVNTWTFNVDALRLSGYWHKERGGKMVAGPVWDFDRTMSSTDGRDSNPAVWRSASGDGGTDFFNYTWWNRLFVDPDFYQKYIDRWVDMRRGALSQAALNAMIDQLNAEISNEAVTRDLARWNQSKRSWTSPFVTNPDTGTSVFPASQKAEVQRLKDYFQQRANFFDSQWVAPVNVSVPEGQVTPGTQVTLTGPAGAVIYYTLDGTDPRPSGGLLPVAAGVLTYSSPVAITASTRLTARAYNGSWTALTGANNPPLVNKWSGLTRAAYAIERAVVPGDLILTEINYNPAGPTPAELIVNPAWQDNDFEFLEIRNLSGDPVTLAGAEITDGVGFAFSGDGAVTVPSRGYVIIASNPTAFAVRYPGVTGVLGPWTGNLSNSGERIAFTNASAQLLLEVTYADSWRPSTDGDGKSLVVYDPLASAAAFSTRENWRASAADGGSPGATEPNRAPNVTAQTPVDGAVNGLTVTASVIDDRQPEPAAVALLWTKVSGPGAVVFADETLATTSAVFSLPGAYVLRLTADDGALSGTGDVTVYAKHTLTTWQASNPGIGALTDDFDKDGFTNLMEFALGTSPSLAAEAPVVRAELSDGMLNLTYSRIRPPSGLDYTVETSSDLAVFAPLPPAEAAEVVLSAEGIRETVRWSTAAPLPGSPRRFVRLRVRVTP